jgi:hypothetical protein
MATKYWKPKALPVAQLTTVTVGGTLAGETFTITVGGVAIASHTDTDTIIASTVAALVAAWNASTHAYATGITAADASPNITLTGDTGGVAGGGTESGSPFILTLNTPGGAATFTQVETTSATSIHDFNNAVNFSDGALPGASDTVIVSDSATNICWGLESVTATDLTLKVEQSFTGMIGLRASNFSANVSGDVYDSSAPEYRPTYLQLDMSTQDIGFNSGTGSPAGSPRIKIHNDKAGVSSTTIHNTSATSADDGLPAVRLKYSDVGAKLYVELTDEGGAGVGVDPPNEAVTMGNIYVDGDTTKFNTGDGVSLVNWTQHGGTCIMGASNTPSSATRWGGTLTIKEGITVTTVTSSGAGTIYLNGIGSTVTTLNQGAVDGTGSGVARTWTTVNTTNGTVKIDFGVVTITNLPDPTTGRYEFGFLPGQ